MANRTHSSYDPVPLYWFKERWNQEIYDGGVEASLEKMGQSRLVKTGVPDFFPEKSTSSAAFQWCPILEIEKQEYSFPTVDVVGFRLMATSGSNDDEEEPTWTPIVEARPAGSQQTTTQRPPVKRQREDDPKESYRLFACKDFNVGDAIIFFSSFEEKTGKNVLGGMYARVSNSEAESNVHMTVNRLLRCSKPIKTGQEIVRWNQQQKHVEYFEKVDRLMFYPKTGLAGRIGQEKSNGEIFTVHYSDGSEELVTADTPVGYGYKMQKRSVLRSFSSHQVSTPHLP